MNLSPLNQALRNLKADFSNARHGFSFEYISTAGKRYGSIPESETRLVVFGSGKASIFRRRGPGDSVEYPPGNYSGTISDETLLGFIDMLDLSGVENIRTETPGPRDPVSFLRVLVSGHLYSFSWGLLRPPTPEPMLRLKLLLVEWSLNACPSPLWSLTMKVMELKSSNGKISARLGLVNTGHDGIHVASPESIAFGPQFAFMLKYGERQNSEEGVTPDPVDIRVAKLSPGTRVSPDLIMISPGSTWEFDFSEPLEGEAPRGWIGKFAFMHYLPSDSLAGVQVFNGALFTKEFQW